MNDVLASQITLALGRNRASLDSGRSRSASGEIGSQISQGHHAATWAEDYGTRNEQVQRAALECARLHDDGSSYSDGVSWPKRKSRMDDGNRGFGKAFWNEMIAALCPGTRNLFIAAGVLAFIVVI